MNKRAIRRLLFIFLLLAAVALLVWIYHQKTKPVTQEVVTFQGTVTDSNCTHTGAPIGGGADCYVKIDGKTVDYRLTTAVSDYNGVIQIKGLDYGEDIPSGTRVNVHAFRLSPDKYTLDQMPGLYVKSSE